MDMLVDVGNGYIQMAKRHTQIAIHGMHPRLVPPGVRLGRGCDSRAKKLVGVHARIEIRCLEWQDRCIQRIRAPNQSIPPSRLFVRGRHRHSIGHGAASAHRQRRVIDRGNMRGTDRVAVRGPAVTRRKPLRSAATCACLALTQRNLTLDYIVLPFLNFRFARDDTALPELAHGLVPDKAVVDPLMLFVVLQRILCAEYQADTRRCVSTVPYRTW